MCVFLLRVAAVAAGWTLPVALHHKLGEKNNSFMDWLIIWITDCFIVWLIDSFICLHLFTQSVFISQNIIFCPSQNKQDQKGHFPLTRTGWRTDNCFFLLSGMELFNGLFLVSLLCYPTPISQPLSFPRRWDLCFMDFGHILWKQSDSEQICWFVVCSIFFATMKCSLILSYNTLQ